MNTDKFVAFTDMLIDGRADTIARETMPEILTADEIKENLISNDIVTIGSWPSGCRKIDFEVRFYEIGKEYDTDPVETVYVSISETELPGYDEEIAGGLMTQRFVENPFGPFRYVIEGEDAFDTAEAAEAFEKALDFYSRADVEDTTGHVINSRKEIEKKFSVSIKPDL